MVVLTKYYFMYTEIKHFCYTSLTRRLLNKTYKD